MKRLLVLLLLLPVVASGATLHEAEYGKAATFNFLLYNTDGSLDVDEVDGGAEVSVACDEGAEGTATNDFVDEGTFYSIALTAAEMSCARVAVVVAATDTNVFFVETYGHPSAQNPCGDQPCLTSGTAQASTSSTIVLASATSIADDYLKGATVTIVDGTGSGQTRVCSSYTNSTDTCTVSENWDTTPSTDSDYLVYRTRFGALSIDSNGRVDVGSIGGTAQTANDVGGDVDSILTDTGTTIPGTITTLQATADGVVLYEGTITSVTSQTQLVVGAGDDPGYNDAHNGQWLCVEDADDASVRDCAKSSDYATASNTWTIINALKFTVEVGDKIWIPVPASNSWVQ